jgi:hypothetical protein
MNSQLNLPVGVALARNYAEKIKFSDGQTNQYVKLPTFQHLVGTLGKPDAKIDKTAVAGLAAKTILNNLDGETSKKVGSALNSLGGLLGGKPATTNAPSQTATTNAPGTNAPAKSPLDLLRKLTK